ncbi:MAG: hypothetical protein ABMA64_23535 [Myxococcota bacterium]
MGVPNVDQGVVTDAVCRAVVVVIGVEDYASLPDVPHAQADAAAFASFADHTLRCPVFAPEGGRQAWLAAVEEAGRTPGISAVWVYFSGNAASPHHPVLLAADAPADPAAFATHGVSPAELRERANPADLVLVVDAALDGRSRTGEELVPRRRFLPPPAVALPPGAVEWWGATPGELAGTLAGHGAFTWAALGALRGWADGARGRPDTRVSADEAQRYAVDALGAMGVSQHPQLRGDLLRTLSLAHEPAPRLDPLAWEPAPAPVAAPPPRPTAALVVHLAVDGVLLVDGVVTALVDRGATVAVGPGRHLVEVRAPSGAPLTALHVDLTDGGRVSLEYRDRQLFVVPEGR